MSSHLQLYLDRAFAIGCDSALEMHAADVLPVANDGYTMIFCPAPERIRISGLRFAFRMSHCARSQARPSRAATTDTCRSSKPHRHATASGTSGRRSKSPSAEYRTHGPSRFQAGRIRL